MNGVYAGLVRPRSFVGAVDMRTVYVASWFVVPGVLLGLAADLLGAPIWLAIGVGALGAMAIGWIISLVELGAIRVDGGA
jgi:hypothetical protein